MPHFENIGLQAGAVQGKHIGFRLLFGVPREKKSVFAVDELYHNGMIVHVLVRRADGGKYGK
jgi:hypothetical protein